MPRPLRQRRGRRQVKQPPTQPVEIAIEGLGRRGDGIGTVAGKPAYVAGTLPGEQVEAILVAERGDGWQARLTRVITASPQRIAPACRHFGTCGGCALQHLSAVAYRDFKRDRVGQALRRAGLGGVAVLEPIVTPPASRRRLTVTAHRAQGVLRLGFNEAASHHIVDIVACPVADPSLVALLPALRDLARRLGRSALDFSLLVLPDGIDVLVRAPDALTLADREALAVFAGAQDLARIAWQEESGTPQPVAARRPVTIAFAGLSLALPPGVFLQATAEGEHAIVAAVLARLAAAAPGPIADFFAGAGTLSLPIAASGRTVHAVDGDAAALAALDKAARQAGLKMTVETRDIERRTPSAFDLTRFAALVFDPPRTGAPALAQILAESQIPLIVAVSCNPESFVRDAATLVAGGYRLGAVQPIDQFLWSPHVELVAAFER